VCLSTNQVCLKTFYDTSEMIFDEYTYMLTYVYVHIVINLLLSGMGMGEEWARNGQGVGVLKYRLERS